MLIAAGPMLIAVFITEMVILHKYVFIIIIITTTTGQRLCTKIIYVVIQTSVRLFQMSSQKKSFLTTADVENKC